ncbi:LUZP5 [Mytilus edulis]|uniref:NCAPG2 n=1 Tax=Mytilus edulis TaxID=6550 RepID=A0A8S3V2D3_MYTED|nr:LUZP5 [Mytilus edulis]
MILHTEPDETGNERRVLEDSSNLSTLEKKFLNMQNTREELISVAERGELDQFVSFLKLELEKLLEVLEGVVNLASAAINQQEIYVPVSLYSTSVVLNGLLLPLPEKAEKLKNAMSHLFEVWWQKEIQGAEELMSNTFIYLLQRSLQTQTILCYIHNQKKQKGVEDMLLKLYDPILWRSLKFWSIVPVEHLLARLEIDTPPIARRIMKLIFSSFMPADKPADVQIGRCVTLIQTNIGAARQFYNKAHNHMSIQDTVNYITLLCRCILQCMKAEAIKNRLNDSASGDGGKLDQDDSQTVKRTRKSVGFVEPSAPRPQLGLEYISYLIKHPTCQAIILSKYRDNVVELIATLQDVRGDNSAILKLGQVITWSDSHLLPVLESQDQSRSNNSTSLSSESENNTHSNTQDFTQGVFSRTLYNVDATVLLSGGRSRKRSIGKAKPHAIDLASNVIQFDLDELCDSFTSLPILSAWLCEIVCRKSFIARESKRLMDQKLALISNGLTKQ